MSFDGYKVIEFEVNGRYSVIVCPNEPLPDKLWIWKTEFFEAFNRAERDLLSKGFYLAYHQVSDMYGCPESIGMMKEFYDVAVNEYGLNKKAALFGFSRGGLYAFNFALRYPECTKMLYLDAPVLNVLSWPGAKGTGLGDAQCWEQCKAWYKITDENCCDFKGNPLDNAERIAETKLPILLICGAIDRYVPYSENGQPFFERVKAADGEIARVVKPYCDHHPHGLYDTRTVCDFVMSVYGLTDEKGLEPKEICYNNAKTVVYGDSITRGTYTAVGDDCPNSVAEKKWIDYVAEHFGLQLLANYSLNGTSISSKTTIQPELSLVNRFDKPNDAELVFVAMGTNDFGTDVPLGKLTDTSDESFYGALDVVCRGLKARYDKAGIIFVTPIKRFDEEKNHLGISLEAYRNAIKEVAFYRYGFRVLNGRDVPIDPQSADIRAKNMVDGVHPDPELQKTYAEFIIGELEKGGTAL